VPSFILIRPTFWPQYTKVTDRTRQKGLTDRTDNGLIAQSEPFYKRSPKNPHPVHLDNAKENRGSTLRGFSNDTGKMRPRCPLGVDAVGRTNDFKFVKVLNVLRPRRWKAENITIITHSFSVV